MNKSLIAFLFGILSFSLTSCQDLLTYDYLYCLNVTETEKLGESELVALEMSLALQGVSLNTPFYKRGSGFGESLAEIDADLKASEVYHLNFNKIVPSALVLINGKGFNYTLYRLTLNVDPNGHVKRNLIESKRITKR